MLSNMFNGKALGTTSVEDIKEGFNKEPSVEKLFKGNIHSDFKKASLNDSKLVKDFFGFGKTEKKARTRINQQKGLSLFGDYDGDKVANILDCNPLNPLQQGPVTRLKNWTRGKGFVEDDEVNIGGQKLETYNNMTNNNATKDEVKQQAIQVLQQVGKGAKTVGTGLVTGAKSLGTGLATGAKNIYQASGIPERQERKETERLQQEVVEKAAFLQAQKDPKFLQKVAEQRYLKEEPQQRGLAQTARKGIEAFDIADYKARKDIRDFSSEASRGVSPFLGLGKGSDDVNKVNQLLGLQSTGRGTQQVLGGGMSGFGAMQMLPRQSGRSFQSVVGDVLGIKQQPQMGVSTQPSQTSYRPIQQPQMGVPTQPSQTLVQPQPQQNGNIIIIEGVQYRKNPPGSQKAYTNLKTGAQVDYPRGKYTKHQQPIGYQPQPVQQYQQPQQY